MKYSEPEVLWQKCMDVLQDEMQLQQFNTWLRPLKVMVDTNLLCLLAPNRFVLDWIKDKFLLRIEEVLNELSEGNPPTIALGVTIGKTSFSYRHNRKTPKTFGSPGISGTAGLSNVVGSEKEVVLSREKKYKHKVGKPLFSDKKQNEQEVHTPGLQEAPQVQKKLDLGIVCSDEPPPERQEKIKPNKPQKMTAMQDSFCSPALKNKQKTSLSYKRELLKGEVVSEKTKQENPSLKLKKNTTKDECKKNDRSNVCDKNKTNKTGKAVLVRKTNKRQANVGGGIRHNTALNKNFTFDSFVEGKSNQLALAAARQIVDNAGCSYNPLFIYGGVGLGKTHLMHAVGNNLIETNVAPNVVYLHSERFVADMVKALQLNAINDFKRYYRSVDALLIDDIQFFSGKERSQEEFFHTFNALLEGGQQVILTCDRYPKEIKGLEERLKSRFGWGLTVAVEPPELETRVAILIKKAEQINIELPSDAAFFIAQKIRSNVRELEGALKKVVACARFMGAKIDIDLIREALKDLFALQDKQVGVENIQKTVAVYFHIKVSDILSKTRVRTIARPRQISMALAKELTNHSLPEIGEAHGGRDHTTVLHACRKIKELMSVDSDVANDYRHLFNSLTN